MKFVTNFPHQEHPYCEPGLELARSPHGLEEYKMYVRGELGTFHCLDTFEYKNGEFTGGLVEGIGPDTIYICIDTEDTPMEQIFLRADEAAAIVSLLGKALNQYHLNDVRSGLKPE
ncbi:hypothetical protein [Leptolinea tardivitalis]|uniref:Uncharacterized protein n=1 Tax=Leptolinea tardivitalis TaxID=229920 RepID=A0A0P6X0L8_9CHLR|nr:hypothetical protein [Leptolinea tardivitalis]KPL72702.1 hypothetical protein ADM99_06355 [Leptolinea tardivitalis]GAP20955.1 hypothetical protein LTAR_01158 [Leptolinea tardivitalis]